jgi:multiple sugar transport system substrate-binding protein
VPGWEELTRVFNAKGQRVTAQLTIWPVNENLVKWQAALAADTVPDIVNLLGWEWQPYAARGQLAELDAYISRERFSEPYPDVPAVRTHTQWKGKTYEVPLATGVMLMLYARKPFQERGIPFPTNDWTFEQFLDLARRVTDRAGATRMFGYQANGIWARDIHWMRQDGEDEFDSLIEPKRARFSQPGIIAATQVVASDVYHRLQVAPTAADAREGPATIQSGNAAMKYEGPWFFPQVNSPEMQAKGTGVPFDVVLMPRGKDSRRRHRGWVEGVNLSRGRKVEAAWSFAKFMAGEEGQRIFSPLSGRMPNSPRLIESFWLPDVTKQFGVQNGRAMIEAYRQSMPDVIGEVPRDTLWTEIVKPDGWDPMVAGTASAREALAVVDQKVQARLDEYWRSK